MAKLKNFIEHLTLALIVTLSVYVRLPARVQPYLWLDEAWRAVAIELNSSLPALISYMGRSEAALLPSEWVLGRVGLFVFGKQELAFRYSPLLFSSVTLLVSYFLIRHVTRSRLAVIAPLLLGPSYLFVRHARHFKPYSLDLLLTITALWAAVLFLSNPSKQRQFLLTLALSVFALSSLPALFVIPGIACYLIYHKLINVVKFARIIGIPLSLYALNYLFILKPQSAGGALDFWSKHYLDDLSKIPFLAESLITFVSSSSFLDWRILLISYFIVLPIISVCRKDGFWILLVAPLIFHAAISSLRLYPLFQRPSIYLYGLVLIGFTYSVCELVKIFTEKLALKQKFPEEIVIALVASGFLFLSLETFQNFERFKIWPTSQGRESFRELAENFAADDRLKFNYGSYFTLEFYQDLAFVGNEHLSTLDFQRSDGLHDREAMRLCADLQVADNAIAPGTRVWFLTTHVGNAYQRYQAILPQVGDVQTHVANFREGLVSVVLEKPLASLDCSVFQATDTDDSARRSVVGWRAPRLS